MNVHFSILNRKLHLDKPLKMVRSLTMFCFICRTMQTAVGVFGGEGYTDMSDVLPLMVANAGNSNRAAISSLNCPPIITEESCREHLVCLSVYYILSVERN